MSGDDAVLIRNERAGDADAIATATRAAFAEAEHSSGTEALIIQALRGAGQLTVSLVAELGGRVIGHVAVSPVRISDESPYWYGLGPVSVLPTHQGRGIGSQLIRASLERLRSSAAHGMRGTRRTGVLLTVRVLDASTTRPARCSSRLLPGDVVRRADAGRNGQIP
jgi:predicted N-acetyltransferase YhbS